MQKRHKSFKPTAKGIYPQKSAQKTQPVEQATCLWYQPNHIANRKEKKTADQQQLSNFEGRVYFPKDNLESSENLPILQFSSYNRVQGYQVSLNGIKTERSNIKGQSRMSSRSNTSKRSLKPFNQNSFKKIPTQINRLDSSSSKNGSYNGNNFDNNSLTTTKVNSRFLCQNIHERANSTITMQKSKSTYEYQPSKMTPTVMAQLPIKIKTRIIQENFNFHPYSIKKSDLTVQLSTQASQRKDSCQSSVQYYPIARSTVKDSINQNNLAFLRGTSILGYKKSISFIKEPISLVETITLDNPDSQQQFKPVHKISEEISLIKRSCETQDKTLQEMNETESIFLEDPLTLSSDLEFSNSNLNQVFESNPKRLGEMNIRRTSSINDQEENLHFSMVIAGGKEIQKKNLRTSFFPLSQIRNKKPTLSGFFEPYTIRETQREIGSSKIFLKE